MFEVDFSNGNAWEVYVTPQGNVRMHNYMLFIDWKGVHVITRNGVIYLTPENAIVL
jgi:hypothetical protein